MGGQPQLLCGVHAGAGGLFPVPQGGVKDVYAHGDECLVGVTGNGSRILRFFFPCRDPEIIVGSTAWSHTGDLLWNRTDPSIENRFPSNFPIVANVDDDGNGTTDDVGETGWTGSDFIQDIMLVQQGPDYVMGLISGEVDGQTRYVPLTDILGAEVLEESGLLDADHDPQRWSLMTDWSRSEFSRLRLQYNRDDSRPDASDNQWTLQYLMSIGSHGAHEF